MGAGNQQERLSHTEELKHFLAGFIEGEGALRVSIKRHPTSRFGYLVDPEFFLYQHESGRRVLELASEVFGTGAISRMEVLRCSVTRSTRSGVSLRG